MRVISGIRRGLKLKAPDGENTRPTTDRVKESIFNIIQYSLPAGKVLDLFSGSGALGIEALSRGSDFCVFVDSSNVAASLTKENIALAKFQDKSMNFVRDSLDYIKNCTDNFDLIFLDPPYNKGLLLPVIEILHSRNLLNDGGIIVVETEKGGETVPEEFYPVRKSVTYGKTTITILQG